MPLSLSGSEMLRRCGESIASVTGVFTLVPGVTSGSVTATPLRLFTLLRTGIE